MPVAVEPEAKEAMRDHAAESYPVEACGVLVGSFDGARVRIVRTRRTRNAAASDRGRSFAIHPGDVLVAEDELAGSGLEIVGFYHSHCDVPAAPSALDRSHAWPGYVYAILAVSGGEIGPVTYWRSKGPGAGLVEERLAP